MSDSLSNWLSLREPADARARSAALTRTIAEALPREGPVHVLDLATGTASNLRFLASHLPAEQRWLVVDRDPLLLAEVPHRTASWAIANGLQAVTGNGALIIRGAGRELRVTTDCQDLGALDAAIFSGRHLVTASALLDLVSESWLQGLADRCRQAGAAVLFALTYDGRAHCTPVEPEDEAIRHLMNRHQKTNNKGFGAAAGPDAAECAARCFAGAGYDVQRRASNWVLPPDARELQRQLIEGWAEAATEMATDQSATIRDWLARRLAHIDDGRSEVVVGHEDLGAWLPSATSPAARGGR